MPLGLVVEVTLGLSRAEFRIRPRLIFLNFEPKWNNLREDPRFQEQDLR
jgi:hypothetical protein